MLTKVPSVGDKHRIVICISENLRWGYTIYTGFTSVYSPLLQLYSLIFKFVAILFEQTAFFKILGFPQVLCFIFMILLTLNKMKIVTESYHYTRSQVDNEDVFLLVGKCFSIWLNYNFLCTQPSKEGRRGTCPVRTSQDCLQIKAQPDL